MPLYAALLNTKTWTLFTVPEETRKAIRKLFKNLFTLVYQPLSDSGDKTNLLFQIRRTMIPQSDFMRMTRTIMDCDTLNWWQINEKKYPQISRYARQY